MLCTLSLARPFRLFPARFARRHRHRLAANEQELAEQGSSPVWAWAGFPLLFTYISLLLWQVGWAEGWARLGMLGMHACMHAKHGSMCIASSAQDYAHKPASKWDAFFALLCRVAQHAAPVLQVLLVVYSWAGLGGKLPFLMGGSPLESSTAFTEASLASEL